MDFEATALALESYPIEVGVAVIAEHGAQPEIWSTLIKPAPSWAMGAQWDPDAERVHGIRRWALRDGLAPRAVMTELNARIPAGAMVWCDDARYDLRWLDALARTAGIAPAFELNDLGATLRQHDELHKRYLVALSRQAKPHRAGPDAAMICAAIVAAIQP